jgi:exodeoxyribonuclease VII large subunit
MKATGRKVYTISEITREMKVLLEGRFPGVWVEGEVSNVRRPQSGHIYFTLKDEGSQLQAVLYRANASRITFGLEDGLHVLAYGDVSLYAKGGRYQLAVSELEPRGRGALQLAFEQLKKRLAAEGLFDEDKKKAIPLLPERIGIVTSPSGAAIRDILNVIQRRFANVRILINPVRVQGDTAAREIADAVDEFNRRSDVDVIIVTRGGGSLEDLWAFNEEIVARAIHRSEIPVISAVGHEIDFTISDFTADLRVPTPSAAAELVVAKKSELHNHLTMVTTEMNHLLKAMVARFRQRLVACEQSYVLKAPQNVIRQYQQLIDELDNRVRRIFMHRVEIARSRLGAWSGRLSSLSPLAVLARGYSVVLREKDGAVVRNEAMVKIGEMLSIALHRGSLSAKVARKSKSKGDFQIVS